MNSLTAPNVGGAEVPGRRTVHSMCGMRAARRPIEATAEDGRMTWLQDTPTTRPSAPSCGRSARRRRLRITASSMTARRTT